MAEKYHAFAGYDSVSAFSDKGKVKPLKTLSSNDEFITTGSSWTLPEDFIIRIERFACSMYGKATNNVNEIRYKCIVLQMVQYIVNIYHLVVTH